MSNNYDPNDPTNKAEFDAYEESQKHETLDEKAQDLGNREPSYVWGAFSAGLLMLLGIVAGIAHALGAC